MGQQGAPSTHCEWPTPTEHELSKQGSKQRGVKERKAAPRRRIQFHDAPVQVSGTMGFHNDFDLPRQQIFEGEHYQYSRNPFKHLATASWGQDPWLEGTLSKSKQIVYVSTLEPDRQGKSKKQIVREFVTESSTNQLYHGPSQGQFHLQTLLRQQSKKERKKQKKNAYHKRRKLQQVKSSRPCEFDSQILNLGELLFEEEICVEEDSDGLRIAARKAQVDDVYKDDFSSGESDAEATPTSVCKKRHLGWLEAAELIFDNSIRDNFQM